MFREMCRARQQLAREEAEAILNRGSSGVLCVQGDGGYPYGVPISYVYADGHIYMHCARSGHKLDAVRACDKACFTVVDADDVVQEEFTTHYRSAIAFGRVRELTGDADKRRVAELLCAKYCPSVSAEDVEGEIKRGWAALNALDFTVEHLSAKQCRELMK